MPSMGRASSPRFRQTDFGCSHVKFLLPNLLYPSDQFFLSYSANLLMSSAPPFVAITVHGFTNSPVSYLPHRVKEAGDLFSTSHLPLKSPKEGGEDTWVLLITHAESKNSTESAQTDGELKWCLMDSLGWPDSTCYIPKHWVKSRSRRGNVPSLYEPWASS